jgi:hypothetical protein
MTIELTEEELEAIRNDIACAWHESQSCLSYETLLKLGFKEDHYMMEHLKKYKDYDRGRE